MVFRRTTSSRGILARAQTMTLRSGTSGIASIIGLGSMMRRSVGGNGMLSGLLTANFNQANRFQNPRRTNHLSIPLPKMLRMAVGVAAPRVMLQFGVAGAQWMAFVTQIRVFVPRLEGVFNVGEASVRELRVMAQDHGLEVGLVDPLQPFPGVDVFVEAVGVETISLQPAAGVQDEDLEHRLAESEAGGPVAFGQRADQQVELLDVFRVVAVNRPQLVPDIRVLGKVVKAPDRIQP